MRAAVLTMSMCLALLPAAPASSSEVDRVQALAACEYDLIQRGITRFDGVDEVGTCMKAQGYGFDRGLPQCVDDADQFFSHECYTSLAEVLRVRKIIRMCIVELPQPNPGEFTAKSEELRKKMSEECFVSHGFDVTLMPTCPIGYGQD